MNDFEYYDKEPKKNGRGFLIAALMIVSIALVGVLVVQYIVPRIDNTPEPTMAQMVQETPAATEAAQDNYKYRTKGTKRSYIC